MYTISFAIDFTFLKKIGILKRDGFVKEEYNKMVYKETVYVDDIEMKYARFGSGADILVIIPGLSIKDVTDMAEVVEGVYHKFTKEYTIYIFDRRTNAKEGYTIRNMADDTATVMRKMEIKNAYIFGASQGGMIAMYMAVYHPELVGGMVLASTASKLNAEFVKVYKNWAMHGRAKDSLALAAAFADNVYSQGTLENNREAIISANLDCSDEQHEHFVIMAQALDTLDIYDELEKIKCKTLVIGSEGDKVVGVAAQREIAKKLGCDLYMYGAEYGHGVYDEAPDYLDRMMDFLKSTKEECV